VDDVMVECVVSGLDDAARQAEDVVDALPPGRVRVEVYDLEILL